MTSRPYADLADSASTFDPEDQFERDRMEEEKGMSKELKPCPFCGKQNAKATLYGPESLFAVTCECGAGVRGYDQCMQDAIDGWNTRQPVELAERHALAREAFEAGMAASHNISEVADGASSRSPSQIADFAELKLLIDEYDPANSDWNFRRNVMLDVLVRIWPKTVRESPVKSALSPSLDAAIQDELDHGPKSIMGEEK